MVREALESIMTRKYRGYSVYVHNLDFDGAFLFKNLVNLTNKVKPIISNGKIISLTIKYGKYSLVFKDSCKILKSSLRKLASSFKVEDKGIFPYEFVNQSNIDFDYVGAVPEFKYFKGITLDDYKDYCQEFNNN